MKTIGDLLSRDLNRKIVEVIQVDADKDEDLYSEITEYIATESIKDQYATLLKAIAEAPADPHDSVGVWISGFFGSGKSSFAKNLGYALQNRQVMNQDFAMLFKQQIEDERVGNLLDSIITRIPAEVVLFEVAKERDTRKVTERIAELMYTVLLRELGYAEDFDIAELEIELEAEGKLDAFVQKCNEVYTEGWQKVRKGAQKVSRASRILHEIDPGTYHTPDSWAHTQRTRETVVTVKTVVERTFELMGRRRPGKAIVFVIDEVGQHVARSGDKIEDLRATVEEFGKIGKNLTKARKIAAPCWIIVTSQEKLDEVVAAIDSKRVDIAKLQDRFKWRVDLAPSDIREVATKRVLAKKPENESDAIPRLKKLFNENPASLNAALRLERTARKTDIDEVDFVLFYPYPPHYIDLSFRGNEVSHDFLAPFTLLSEGSSLRERIANAQSHLNGLSVSVERRLDEINATALEAYRIGPEDRLALTVFSDQATASDDGDSEQEQEDPAAPTTPDRFVEEILSYAVGCVFGRWDIRLATSGQEPESPPDPLAPLPITSPGTLRCSETGPLSGSPKDYPLRIDWDGILVDDVGNQDDIVRRVRDVLEVIWKDRADAIEKEACEILGVKTLRDHFRKPGKGGFWDDHVKRYSKSRRKAPIYWLLQSSKKNYALWLYYHRLDKDMLFKALLNYVEPKIQREENRLAELRAQKSSPGDSGKGAKKLDRDIEKQEDLLSELRDFAEKLRKVADLHLVPDLNDGVVLNIAPLHELVPWKEAKKYWEELTGGKYEWSSIGKQLREKGLVK